MSMALRLAIDTATDRLAVAAGRPGSTPREFVENGVRPHARELPALIDRALGACDGRLADVVEVVLADGPGSFTGLRIGAAVAKAILAGGTARLLTAPGLLARAAAVASPGDTVAAVTDALRGEVYLGVWHFAADRGVRCLVPPAPRRADDLPGLIPLSRVVGDVVPDTVSHLTRAHGLASVERVDASAAALWGLADRPGAVTAVPEPAGWEPEYGRPAEAQVRWEQAHGRRLDDPDTRRE